MAKKGRGIFLVYTDIDPIHEDEFNAWYNTEHRHSGIGLLTPADVHFGRAAQIITARAAVSNSSMSTCGTCATKTASGSNWLRRQC